MFPLLTAFALRLFAGITLSFTALTVGVSLVGQQALRGPTLTYAADHDGQNDLYIMDVDRGLIGSLTQGFGNSYTPAWSPDGERLAFASNRSGTMQIYMLDAGSLRQLTDEPGSNTFPTWSPDGTHIAFVSNRSGQHQIYVMNAEGGDLRQITHDETINAPPVWSPDAEQFAIATLTQQNQSDEDIGIVTLDGNLYPLTDNQQIDTGPTWSPDGRHIAFVSDRDGPIDIYVMGADGSDIRRLTEGYAQDSRPTWSPDGAQITFVSCLFKAAIFLMNADGSNLRQLTDEGTLPAWSPDGRYVAYIVDSGRRTEIYLVDAAGGRPRRLTGNSVVMFTPVWRP